MTLSHNQDHSITLPSSSSVSLIQMRADALLTHARKHTLENALFLMETFYKKSLERLLLRNCVFEASSLLEADLLWSEMAGCLFTNCAMDRVNLGGTVLSSLVVQKSEMRESLLTSSMIQDARFLDVKAQGGAFSSSEMDASHAFACDFRESHWEEALVSNSSFEDCSFVCAHMRGGQFTNTTFEECDFSRADFSFTDLSFSRFRGSSLSGANLYGATLRGTDLSQEQLESTSELASIKMSMLEAFRFIGRRHTQNFLEWLTCEDDVSVLSHLDLPQNDGRETLRKRYAAAIAFTSGVFQGEEEGETRMESVITRILREWTTEYLQSL